MKLRTYIVEDNATIRENLIGTLEELAEVQAIGCAETEDEGKAWLTAHAAQWDLAIVDLAHREGVGAGLFERQRIERDAAVRGVLGGRHDLAVPALELKAKLARLELGALEHLGGAQLEGDGRGLVAVGERH